MIQSESESGPAIFPCGRENVEATLGHDWCQEGREAYYHFGSEPLQGLHPKRSPALHHLVALTIPYFCNRYLHTSPVGIVLLVKDPITERQTQLLGAYRTHPPACFLATAPNDLRAGTVKEHLRPGQTLKTLRLGASRHTIKERSWVSGACGATLGPNPNKRRALGFRAQSGSEIRRV
jgi:hypothetical protein